jgi:serine/threonine protein kinase
MTVISAGTRLGPYEVVSRLGAGGMGEVWKARDTRLDRSVAIKVLPAEVAQNAEFRLRFEREAKTISQLTHPHICTLYDVGDDYLVMELLDGETLADRLGRGPLPLSDVLKYGAQIGEALDRAHRAGVVHRDLKPGNVMITRSGAKLLDFGLAKGWEMALAEGETMAKPLTREGTILGTLPYMAPEQLEGAEADARTGRASSTGISSPGTSCSPARAPSSWTSAWRAPRASRGPRARAARWGPRSRSRRRSPSHSPPRA